MSELDTDEAGQTALRADQIRAALRSIVGSEPFVRAARLREMLTYLVEETLAGRTGNIKAFSIAVDVFDRDSSFDPNSDPLVRVQAGRLRTALATYYAGAGRNDPLRIEIPTGSYVPVFVDRPVMSDRAPGSDDLEQRTHESAPAGAAHSDAVPKQPIKSPPAQIAGRKPAGSASRLPSTRRDTPPSLSHWRNGVRCILEWPVLSVMLVGLAVLAAIVVFGRPGGVTPRPSAIARPPVLAVSPLTIVGGDADTHFVAEGLRFDLIAELARFSWMAVSANRSQAAVPGESHKSDIIQRTPDYVLEGSIGIKDGTAELSYHLISRQDGLVKWSKRTRAAMSGGALLRSQREAVEAVAVEIGQPTGVIQHLEQGRYRGRSDVAGSYICLLRVYAYWVRFDEKTHANVRDCLEKAIAIDATYAQAHAALAFIYLDEARYKYNVRTGYDPLKRALAAAEEADRLDPFDVLAKQALFTCHHFNGHDAAFKHYGRAAIALSPNNPDVLADFGNKLATYYGEWEEGLRHTRRARELNAHPPTWYFLSEGFAAIKDNENKSALELSEYMQSPPWVPYHIIKVLAATGLGERPLAQAQWRSLSELGMKDAASIRAAVIDMRYHTALQDLLLDRLTASLRYSREQP